MQTRVFYIGNSKWQIRAKRPSRIPSISPIEQDWQLLGECFDEQTARLWAASFDLLEACRTALRHVIVQRSDADNPYAQIVSAISKATN